MVLTASQAIGPAIGGLLVASLGAGAVFDLNAVSFLAVVGVVAAWRRPRLAPGLPPEHVSSAIRTGLRYVANAPAFRVVLIRAGAYVLSFSALPALLAVFTRSQLHGTASDYGLLHRWSLRRADLAACSRQVVYRLDSHHRDPAVCRRACDGRDVAQHPAGLRAAAGRRAGGHGEHVVAQHRRPVGAG
jgi:hypothetical protein